MFVVASVGMGTVVLSLAEMASMWEYLPVSLFLLGCKKLTLSLGLQHLVDNTTGHRSLRRRKSRDS